MKIQRGYARRLYLTPSQAAILDLQGHAARALWNLLHEWWTWGGRHRRPSLKEADQAIRQARADIPWLADLPAQAAQQVLRTYVRAWRNCWEGRANPPKYKSRHRSRLTVDNPSAADLYIRRLNRRWYELTALKVGRVRVRWSGPVPGISGQPGRVTGARFIKDSLGWYVRLRTEREVAAPAPHRGPTVGMDRGVTVALALSDGNDQRHGPWHRPSEAKRLIRLQRKAARQQRARKPSTRTSNRLHRTYDQIEGLHARAKRRRLDWQHKTTTTLAREYAVVAVEDLRLRSMLASAKGTSDQPGRNVRQKAGLNRAMLGEAHGRTVELLGYKLAERGGAVVKVPAAGTSQTCSTCGHHDPASRSGAKFACTACGWVGHADSNAAVNIKNAAGLAVYGRGADAVGRGREASTARGRKAVQGIGPIGGRGDQADAHMPEQWVPPRRPEQAGVGR